MTAELIRIVDYEPMHLRKIQMRACHMYENITEVHTPAVTFLYHENPMAIFGWFFINSGVIQVWGILSDTVKLKPISFHKSVKLMLEYAHKQVGARRIQISVREDYLKGRDWARALGFTCEGKMMGYGADGSNYDLFARVTS